MPLISLIVTGTVLASGLYMARRRKVQLTPSKEPITQESESSSPIAPCPEAPAEPGGLLELALHRAESQLGPIVDDVYDYCANALVERLPQNDEMTNGEEGDSEYSQSITISAEERSVNRELTLSCGVLAVNSAALLTSSALAALSLPGVLALSFGNLRGTYKELFKERRIGFEVADCAVLLGLLVSGHWYAWSLFALQIAAAKKSIALTRNRSRKQISTIIEAAPRKVWIERDGVEIEIAFAQLCVNDRLVLRAGEVLAADGIIIDGRLTLDERALTGEAEPAQKGCEDTVFAGSLALSGSAVIRVDSTGTDTISGQITEILQNSTEHETRLQLRAEKVAELSIWPTVVVGLGGPLLVGIQSTVALLTCSFGYQMRYTGPVSILSHLHVARRNGLLVKDGRVFEAIGDIDLVVFDKTGTLTTDTPQVTDIHSLGPFNSERLLAYAAALEQRVSHPIARSIVEAANERGIKIPDLVESEYRPAYGLHGFVSEHALYVGSWRFIFDELGHVPTAQAHALAAEAENRGAILVFIVVDGLVAGALELGPKLREGVPEVLAALKERHIQTYLISGDQESSVRRVAEELELDGYHAGVLPADKSELVEGFLKAGRKVCFVGDGINDALALKKATVSVSLRGASTIAVDTAQVVVHGTGLWPLLELWTISETLEQDMKSCFAASVMPGIASIPAVLAFGWGVPGCAVLAWTGFGAGMMKAVLPRLRQSLALPAPEEEQPTP